MKTIAFSLLGAMLCCFSGLASAQTTTPTPTRYQVYSYIKVNPGMYDDYLKLEKAWKKIHAAKKKAGSLSGWALLQVLSPDGAASEYDFVTRNSFTGDEQLAGFYEGAYMPDNWQNLLTPEELALVNRTNEIRTLVKNEVWSTVDATISVFNYFNFPEGKTSADHIKMEREIWKPVHDARIKDGKMKAWLLLSLQFPFGSSMPYQDATIDVYTDMKELLAPWFEDYFAKVHPGKDVNTLLEKTSAVADLVKGELRMRIDVLD